MVALGFQKPGGQRDARDGRDRGRGAPGRGQSAIDAIIDDGTVARKPPPHPSPAHAPKPLWVQMGVRARTPICVSECGCLSCSCVCVCLYARVRARVFAGAALEEGMLAFVCARSRVCGCMAACPRARAQVTLEEFSALMTGEIGGRDPMQVRAARAACAAAGGRGARGGSGTVFVHRR